MVCPPEPMEADQGAPLESDYGYLEDVFIRVEEESMVKSDSEQKRCRKLDREIARDAREVENTDLNLQASDEDLGGGNRVLKTGKPDKRSREGNNKTSPARKAPEKNAKVTQKSTKDTSRPREDSRASSKDAREKRPSSQESNRTAGWRGRDIKAIAAGEDTTTAPLAKSEKPDVRPKQSTGKGATGPRRGDQKARPSRMVITGAREQVRRNAKGLVEPAIDVMGKWRSSEDQER